jgi:hypothetical protein
MTTLADSKIRGLLPTRFIDPPMVANDIIYLGAATGLDDGFGDFQNGALHAACRQLRRDLQNRLSLKFR